MAWRALAVMLVLLGVAWGGVSAQAPVEITIFVDEDTLTVFIPEQGIVSVYGLAIEVDTGPERITRTLDFYPSLRGLRLDAIPTPICYRLERDTSARSLPLDCPESSTLIQRVASADVFWYDRISGFRNVLVMQGALIQRICPAGLAQCTFTFDPLPFTPTPSPQLLLAHQGVSANSDWIAHIETFNDIEMVLVPVGCYSMGLEGKGGRQCFNKPFWIDRYEVTNAQYKRCVDAGSCTPPYDVIFYGDQTYNNYPVIELDWTQAVQYAQWRGGRLPTESEWEYAARGPDNLEYPWGSNLNGTLLNSCDAACEKDWRSDQLNDGYEQIAPIGSFPNGISWVGAQDMSGNVWEWTSTIFRPYPYVGNDGREDADSSNKWRVLRGGSWYYPPNFSRSTFRVRNYPTLRFLHFGCRVVFDATPL